MQFFEILLIIVSTAYIGLNRFISRKPGSISTAGVNTYKIKKPGARTIAGFLVLVLLLHLILNGYRWQMIPAYFLWLIALVAAIRQSRQKPKLFIRVLKTTGIVVILAFSVILPSVLPVFELPEPRGPYNVGTESIYVTTDRDEIITKDPDDKRELVYRIWYPGDTDVSSMKREKYVDRAGRIGFALKYGLPPASLNYLDKVKTFVYPDIPVADGQFPVLIFSHGYGSKATGYYALLTEIASQGYVIINMNHTYESLGVTFPDGRMKFFDYEYQKEISQESTEVIETLQEAFRSGLDFNERHPIVRNAVKKYHMHEMQKRWAEDIATTIDMLEKWNAAGLLKGKIDLDKTGVFGHSVGGGASGNIAIMDNRIKAAANLDGIPWGNLIDTTLNIPFLYVSADWPEEHEDINSHIFINRSRDYFYECRLIGSGHPNFMDIPFMIPVRLLSGAGEIDPGLGMEIVTKLVTSFFDKHLKNDPESDPQKISEEYDLLELTLYKGDSLNAVSK